MYSVVSPNLLPLAPHPPYRVSPLRCAESTSNICFVQEGHVGIVVGILWVGSGEGSLVCHCDTLSRLATVSSVS
jgi:hypothetical protein